MASSINIKNEEAASLIAQLTATTGKGTTEIILELLRQEVKRRSKLADSKARRRRIDMILQRARKKIPKHARRTEELLDYDENGLPV